MSLHRYQRGVRNLGLGTSRLARPVAVLEEPDIRPTTITLRDGSFPKPVESVSQAFSGTSTTINIGYTTATPANYWNIVLVVSNQAPNVPSGWTLTMTTVPGPADAFGNTWRCYVLERAADTSTTVTITFPTVASPNNARGGVCSLAIDDTTVIAEGTTSLSGVTSTTIDIDRVDPDAPTTIVFGLLTVRGNTPSSTFDGLPSWDFLVGASGGTGGGTTTMNLRQYEGDPPSTTWTATGTLTFAAWLYFELGSP